MKQIIYKILVLLLGKYGYSLINNLRYIHMVKKIKPVVDKYELNKDLIIDNIKRKDKIKILFFIYKLSMWKYDGLCKLLTKSPYFEAVIVPYILPENNFESNKKDSEMIIEYSKMNGFIFREGYDFKKKCYNDISDINPDIVVYTQPYNLGYKYWKIENFIDRCLFVYTPYGIAIAKDKHLRNTLLSNISWKIFSANKIEADILIKNRINKKCNVVETGISLYDDIRDADISKNPWKENGKLKIIWAPHHSIDNKYSFSSSNFEDICHFMVDIAIRYKDKIQMAFKPHPILYERLIEKWGINRTNEYYRKWNEMENTFVSIGDYAELFAFSNAMIHDCSSFTGEYLIANRPVLFLCKEVNKVPSGVDNDFGKACFNCNYHGYNINDIENFIDMLIRNEDPMKDKRSDFVNKYLTPPNNCSTAENMMNELMELVNL